MSKFFKQGSATNVLSNDFIITDTLPVGNYTVKFDQLKDQFYLDAVESFTVGKAYGEANRYLDRIMSTFNDRPSSTGVLLAGEKGCGKTMLAKMISIEAAKVGVPTLIINEPHHGDNFNRFIQTIDQPCVVVFDEFEKTYRRSEDQESMLTLLDGTYPSKKLFIVTSNDLWAVNQHMINRPGRLFYCIEYGGVSEAFIEEYCAANLRDAKHVPDILRLSSMFVEFNFDMMKALVEELNRYGDTVAETLRIMNIKIEGSDAEEWDTKVYVKGVEVHKDWQHGKFNPSSFWVGWYETKEDASDDNDDSVTLTLHDLITMTPKGYEYERGDVKVIVTKRNRKDTPSLSQLF